jgi:hypothetical protein
MTLGAYFAKFLEVGGALWAYTTRCPLVMGGHRSRIRLSIFGHTCSWEIYLLGSLGRM